MNKLEKVRAKAHELYTSQNPNREEWSDWLYPNHVLVVAESARKLARKYNVNEELSEVAALLHDIADVRMARKDPNHEQASLEIAREVMAEAGYTADEIALVVDDAVKYHSCHDNERPESKEGLVLATADSLAHLQTDFYIYAAWAFGKDRSLQQLREWVLKKIERDLNNKISFEDERESARADYNMIKELFSR